MTPAGRRRLILTRHAKSSWDDARLNDHDRPLNKRGQRAAMELGEWLVSRGYEPDEVLCSTSLRTRETWARVVAAPIETVPDVSYSRDLYHASPDQLLAAVRKARGDCVMLLGHNPGLAAFAATLPARAPCSPEFRRYPTTATLVVDFDIEDWTGLRPGSGSVLDFFVPARRG